MPTKQRRAREAQLRQQREEDERAWAEFDAMRAAMAPVLRAEIEARSGFDPDDLLCPEVRTVGITFDEDGQPMRSPLVGTGGNKSRADEKADAARDLIRKYPQLWGARNAAKKIARLENLSVETVRRYFRETRKTTGQTTP